MLCQGQPYSTYLWNSYHTWYESICCNMYYRIGPIFRGLISCIYSNTSSFYSFCSSLDKKCSYLQQDNLDSSICLNTFCILGNFHRYTYCLLLHSNWFLSVFHKFDGTNCCKFYILGNFFSLAFYIRCKANIIHMSILNLRFLPHRYLKGQNLTKYPSSVYFDCECSPDGKT